MKMSIKKYTAIILGPLVPFDSEDLAQAIPMSAMFNSLSGDSKWMIYWPHFCFIVSLEVSSYPLFKQYFLLETFNDQPFLTVKMLNTVARCSMA